MFAMTVLLVVSGGSASMRISRMPKARPLSAASCAPYMWAKFLLACVPELLIAASVVAIATNVTSRMTARM